MATIIPVLSKTPNLLNELVKVLPQITFHEVTDPESDPHFRKSEILICDFNLLGPYLYNLPETKWVQGTWAGIDSLKPFLQNKPIPYMLTRFTGTLFGRMMSEYVITNIVNYERNFFEMKRNRDKHDWDKSSKFEQYRIISDLTMGILGLGNIGNKIGQTLHFMGAKILAFGRKPTLPNTSEYNHVAEYYTKDTLAELLKNSDYIINVLPKTDETTGLLDNDILENCRDRQSVLINIGRSNIISENAIIKAIDNKWLSAAILDVFDKEPLPKNNLLWQHEKIFITPHVAGVTRAKDVAEQFQINLIAYRNKQPLPATVDFNKGY